MSYLASSEILRLNTSLLRLFKVECTLGEPKSLGLIGTECIVTTQANDAHICKVITFET